MKIQYTLKKILLLAVAFIPCIHALGQLNVSTAMTPNQLVQNVLVGTGVTVSNVTSTGTNTMIGSFTNGSTTNLGLASGVVLASGNVTNIPQPVTAFMGDLNGQAGDVDLDALGSGGTQDASVLQFDFVPLSDTIQFRYVFGSEEYPEFVCSSFNDVFGFFLSGPGITGPYSNNSTNIALIPGTSLPVAINTVNQGNINLSYPATGCTSLAYSSDFVDNQTLGGTTIVFDGFTTVLTAWHVVTPCQSYHIKIAVADVGDQNYDSGVFLEANSFSALGFSVKSSYSNSAFGNNAIEGCTQGIFSFVTSTIQTTPLVINYTISGTATNGVDYSTIPSSVTIPAGSDSVSIIVNALADALTEGTETVVLTMTSICSTYTDTIYIIDNTPLIPVAAGTATICPGNSTSISVSASGGMTPYAYSWSNGAGTGTSATVTPAGTTTYVVTVTDFCGQTATDDVTVTVSNNLSVTVSPNSPTICPGDPVALTASGGATSYTWSPPTGLSSTTGASVTASPTTTTTYTVTGNSNGCTGSAQVTVNVTNNAAVTITPVNPSICLNGSVTLTAAGTNNYTWSPAAGLSTTTGPTVIASPTTTTTYSVLGTSGGCSGTASVTVNVISISATATGTDENCGKANGTVTAIPSGNCTQAYSYSWSTIPAQTTVTATHLSAGTYTVTVFCGACTATTNVTINNIAGPSVSISSITNTTCGLPNGGATATGSGGNTPYVYSWSNSYIGQSLSGVPSGNYDVTVTDASGCIATNTVNIPSSTSPTSSISATTAASCGMSDGGAILNVSSGTSPYAFNWNSTPPQTSQNLTNVATGNYAVTVTDANGCTCSSTVIVNEKPGPSVSASSVNEICQQANGTATAVGSGGLGTYTYLWSNGQTTPTATGLIEGSYTVTVNDGGCTSSTSVYVFETPGPTAGFSAHPSVLTLMDGPVNFQDNSSLGVTSWAWDFGDGTQGTGNTPQHQYGAIGTYLVTLIVIDNNGCSDTIIDSVKVKEIYTFYIPNAFSPDDDQFNDVFTPYGINVDPANFKMYIFNRWGNLMFYTDKWQTTHAEPWNGTLNNSGAYDQVVPGVYVYRILLKELDGPRHEYIGSITIVR